MATSVQVISMATDNQTTTLQGGCFTTDARYCLGFLKLNRVSRLRCAHPGILRPPATRLLRDRRFQSNKCSQLFIRPHNETLSLAAGLFELFKLSCSPRDPHPNIGVNAIDFLQAGHRETRIVSRRFFVVMPATWEVKNESRTTCFQRSGSAWQRLWSSHRSYNSRMASKRAATCRAPYDKASAPS